MYKCAFSPDGKRVASCSEDQTIRTWSVPEGFPLFIYRGHAAPVITVKFSPSGKYLLSASDYGERKIIMWDASMPRLEQTLQFPHMIIWDFNGLIKRILMRRAPPDPSFWLTAEQLSQIDGLAVEGWFGEGAKEETFESDNESDSDADMDDDDSSSDEEGKEDDPIDKDDVRDKEGAAISAVVLLKGKRTLASEYNPGGKLVISLQSIITPIAEAFISIQQKSTQFESFDATAGTRLGTFVIDAPLPWEMDQAIIDPLGYKQPRRPVVPEGLVEQADGKAVYYKEEIRYNEEREALPGPPEVEVDI